jgi:taurine--2-oxoglutarate transaminase
MVLGKGITSGAVPLGAVMISSRIAKFFEDRMLWSGLTNFGHPIACAAGIGALKAYSEERLVENASALGQILKAKLERFAAEYEVVAEVRSIGLLACLELVTDRETKEPLVAWGQTTSSKLMDDFAQFCLERGVYVRTRWGLVFVAPPLCITKDELDSGLAVIDEGLMRLQKSHAHSAPRPRRAQPNAQKLTRS